MFLPTLAPLGRSSLSASQAGLRCGRALALASAARSAFPCPPSIPQSRLRTFQVRGVGPLWLDHSSAPAAPEQGALIPGAGLWDKLAGDRARRAHAKRARQACARRSAGSGRAGADTCGFCGVALDPGPRRAFQVTDLVGKSGLSLGSVRPARPHQSPPGPTNPHQSPPTPTSFHPLAPPPSRVSPLAGRARGRSEKPGDKPAALAGA